MRSEYWCVRIFYKKRPAAGQFFELDFDEKYEAIIEANCFRELGYKVDVLSMSDTPVFLRIFAEDAVKEAAAISKPAPAKRGRKAKYA